MCNYKKWIIPPYKHKPYLFNQQSRHGNVEMAFFNHS